MMSAVYLTVCPSPLSSPPNEGYRVEGREVSEWNDETDDKDKTSDCGHMTAPTEGSSICRREAQDPTSPAGCGATQPPPTTVSQTAGRAGYLQNLPA